MIFISYTHKNEAIVDPIAQKLATVFGQENIFYDKWSIQPGDGIINEIDKGLKTCRFFFYFVSQNSLQSKMVKLEWQNALMKATKNQAHFIPVKLDACMMPDILLQNLYIDIFGKGLEASIRQMIDVIQGRNIYRPGVQTYQNVRGYTKKGTKKVIIEFRAETYLEPVSRYLILLDNRKEEVEVHFKGEMASYTQFYGEVVLNTGLKFNGWFVKIDRGTSPGFPVVVIISQISDKPIKITGLMHAIKQDEFEMIPMIEE